MGNRQCLSQGCSLAERAIYCGRESAILPFRDKEPFEIGDVESSMVRFDVNGLLKARSRVLVMTIGRFTRDASTRPSYS